jgi:predicted nucleic acid-binding protein
MSAERVLIDTNVFVYAMDAASPRCAAASTFLDDVTSGGFFGCIAPQVLFELVSVVTNPKRVASVRTAQEAWAVADSLADALAMLTPPANLYFQMSELGRSLGVKAQDVFDLSLAITALDAGVSVVYTFDPAVFSRVSGITVRTPGVVRAP